MRYPEDGSSNPTAGVDTTLVSRGRWALVAADVGAHTSIVVASTTLEVLPSESCELFAAVAEPARLAILQTLVDAPSCVCDLQSSLDIAPNLLSYHLRILRDAGLVRGTKRGRWVDYELAPTALDRLHAAVPRRRPDG